MSVSESFAMETRSIVMRQALASSYTGQTAQQHGHSDRYADEFDEHAKL